MDLRTFLTGVGDAAGRDAVALRSHGGSVTYGELQHRSDAVASALLSMGIRAGDRVGTALPRSCDAVIAAVGILKAGAVYVPHDLHWPDERRRFIADDAGLQMVLDAESFPRYARRAAAAPDRPPIPPEAPAYVIYTSGSTGTPKGVMVSHGSLRGHLDAVIRRYGLSGSDVVVQFSSLAFDASIEQIFATLCAGGTLVPWSDDVYTTEEVLALLERDGVTVLNLPTAYWHTLTHDISREPVPFPRSLRLVIAGGERMPFETARLFQTLAPDVRLMNAYGPTETTITATLFEVPSPLDALTAERGQIPIGTAVSGRLYVGDAKGLDVAPGETGELAIAGERVAIGYLGQEQHTAMRFRRHYCTGERLYLTGDLVRERPDGNLEYVGRIDDQLKVRGFRVEPGEVEAAIHALVPRCECAVIAAGEADVRRIVAFVAPELTTAQQAVVRNRLEARLPSYMVPSQIRVLERLPRTPAGKIDRGALLAILGTGPEPSREGDRGSICDHVAELFAGLLRVPRVGPEDDFFELGGQSLLVIRAIGRLHKSYGVRLTFRDFYRAATPEKIAQILAAGDHAQPRERVRSF